MTWTGTQKQIAAMACKSIGLADEQRKLILWQIPAAFHDAKGKARDEPSSTSARLTNGDFEYFMAQIERHAGGKLTIGGKQYTAGYWRAKCDDVLHRMRHLADRIAAALEEAGHLEAGGVGLSGWISRRVTNGGADQVEQLDYAELHALINGLRAYARRKGVWTDRAGTGGVIRRRAWNVLSVSPASEG